MSRRGITSKSYILTTEDGTPRPESEAIKMFGRRAVWVARLEEVLKRKISSGLCLSFPNRSFLSYRWGGELKERLVTRIAQRLWDLGYIVFHDRLIAQGELPPAVPELVGMIANCNLYVAIIDQGFTDRIGLGGPQSESIDDGWVYDELKTAFILDDADKIEIVGLFIENCELPRGGFGDDYKLYDFRDHSKIDELIDRFFAYDAPPVVPFDVGKLVRFEESIMSALLGHDLTAARNLANEMMYWNDQIPDGYYRCLLISLTEALVSKSKEGFSELIDRAHLLQERFPRLLETAKIIEVARKALTQELS